MLGMHCNVGPSCASLSLSFFLCRSLPIYSIFMYIYIYIYIYIFIYNYEVPCGFDSTNSDLLCLSGAEGAPCISSNWPDNALSTHSYGVEKNKVIFSKTETDEPSSSSSGLPCRMPNLPDNHSVAALQDTDIVTTTVLLCVTEADEPSSSNSMLPHMMPNLPDNYSAAALQNADIVTPDASLFSDFDTRTNRAVQKNSLKKQKVKGASLMYSKDLRKTLRDSTLTANSEVAQRYLSARASQPVGSKRQSPSSFDQPVRGVPVPPPKKKKDDGDCTFVNIYPRCHRTCAPYLEGIARQSRPLSYDKGSRLGFNMTIV